MNSEMNEIDWNLIMNLIDINQIYIFIEKCLEIIIKYSPQKFINEKRITIFQNYKKLCTKKRLLVKRKNVEKSQRN